MCRDADARSPSYPFQIRLVSVLRPFVEAGERRSGFDNVLGAELVAGKLASKDYTYKCSEGIKKYSNVHQLKQLDKFYLANVNSRVL